MFLWAGSDFVAAALRRGGRGSRRPMWVQRSRQQAHTAVVAHGAALVCDHMVAEEGRLLGSRTLATVSTRHVNSARNIPYHLLIVPYW